MLTSAASRRLPARWCDGARTEIRFILLGGRASAAVVPSASVMSCYWCSAFRATERCGTGKGVSAHPSPPAADLWWNAYSENRRVLEQRKLGVGLRLPRGFPAGLTADRQTTRCVGSVPSRPPPGSARPSRISTEPARSAARSARGRHLRGRPRCDQPAAPKPFDWPSRSVCGRTPRSALRDPTRATKTRARRNPQDRTCRTAPARPTCVMAAGRASRGR